MIEKIFSNPNNDHALIVAHDQALGIGKNNKLPWHIKEDMQFFRTITCDTSSNASKKKDDLGNKAQQEEKKQNVVIMGRKTWESLPSSFKPLPNRINLVLTKNADYSLPTSVLVSKDLQEALHILTKQIYSKIFVIGGASIYKEALKMDIFRTLYVTEIEGQYDCDVFFPEYRDIFNLIESSPISIENNYRYCRKIYQRKL